MVMLMAMWQKFFDKNVLLGRNGGDEFCIFLPDCTCADVKEKLEEFTKLKRSFKYEGEEHQFTISVGYAEYPVHADKPSKLMRCADTALYEVKLRGKNGCMAYKNGLRKDIRTPLLHLKMFLKIFQEHLSYTKQIRMMMKFFLQTVNLSDLQAVRTWMNCLYIQKEVSVISLEWMNGKLL